MHSIKSLVAPMIVAIAILCSLSSAKVEDISEVEHLCNLKVNADESNEEWDISFLISFLIEQTPVQGYSQHISYNGYTGSAGCNGEISKEDCDDCLDYANNVIFQACRFSDGAQIKLADCRLRFEHYQINDADW